MSGPRSETKETTDLRVYYDCYASWFYILSSAMSVHIRPTFAFKVLPMNSLIVHPRMGMIKGYDKPHPANSKNCSFYAIVDPPKRNRGSGTSRSRHLTSLAGPFAVQR